MALSCVKFILDLLQNSQDFFFKIIFGLFYLYSECHMETDFFFLLLHISSDFYVNE